MARKTERECTQQSVGSTRKKALLRKKERVRCRDDAGSCKAQRIGKENGRMWKGEESCFGHVSRHEVLMMAWRETSFRFKNTLCCTQNAKLEGKEQLRPHGIPPLPLQRRVVNAGSHLGEEAKVSHLYEIALTLQSMSGMKASCGRRQACEHQLVYTGDATYSLQQGERLSRKSTVRPDRKR